MKTVILLPTYNESDSLPFLVPAIFSQVLGAEVWVIDDNSPDGTGALVENLTTSYPKLKLIKRVKKEGLGAAYLHGIDLVLKNNEVGQIIMMDADGSHDPSYLPAMIKSLEENDLVIGSRYVAGGGIRHWSLLRRFLSRFANFYARLVTGLPIHDLTAGFLVWRREALAQAVRGEMKSEHYAFLIELKFKTYYDQLKIKEWPIVFIERREGISKMDLKVLWEGITMPVVLNFSRK